MFSFFNSDKLPIDNTYKQNTLSPARQDRVTKSLLFLAGLYSTLEACDLFNITGRLSVGVIAACMIANLLYGDGEYDPEQQPNIRY